MYVSIDIEYAVHVVKRAILCDLGLTVASSVLKIFNNFLFFIFVLSIRIRTADLTKVSEVNTNLPTERLLDQKAI